MASLAEVLRALASGTISARAYTDNLLARARARDERVRAWATLDKARARALADACDGLRREDAILAPLHGLAVGVKDIFDTCDLATEYGSPAYAEHRPAADALVVERLKRAGGFVLGKTATTELAYMAPADTRNPWNLNHTPGGSSAGSAAAVAAGFLHVAIGTQTNGSVIRPAAFCGVVGYKPTQGLLPFTGALHFSPTLDQVGTFARTPADVALFTAHLAEGESIPAVPEAQVGAPTIGALATVPWTSLEGDAREHFQSALKRIAAAGAKVRGRELPPVFGTANLVHRNIMLHEAARQLADRQAELRARFSAQLNDGIDEGRRISQATYGEMLARRAALMEAANDLFESVEVIVTPAAPGAAPRRLDYTGDPGYCTLWSLVGFPAITVPSGLSSGLMPYGLQIVARAGEDATLLRAASWIAAALGPLQRPDREADVRTTGHR